MKTKNQDGGPVSSSLMKAKRRDPVTAASRKLFALVALTLGVGTPALFAATNTWVGNTDTNWNTAANWSPTAAPTSGDSLVFGAAGSAGTALNNNISGLSVLNFTINSGASAFTFGGNAVILKGALTNAASVSETFSAGISIGAGAASAIKNVGSGTLSLGAVTQAAAPGGTVDFANTGGGALTTTSANTNSILGGWATTGNGANWAANDGSGNIITYTGYTSITAATAPSAAQNWQANNAASAINASGTINSLNVLQDFTVNAGVTMTLGSGGIILGGTERWLKAGNTTTSIINSGLGTGELYIHANTTGYANGFQVQPVVTDGSVASALIKDGPGQVQMQNANNTYSGGTYLNTGAIYLGSSSTGAGASVTKGPLGTGLVTLNGGTLNLNAQTLGNNLSVPAGVSVTVDNRANNGTLNGNATGTGTITFQNSSGTGLSEFLNGDWSGFTGTFNYNCSAGTSKNFNIFAPANLDLSQATVNFTNTLANAGSTFRGNTTCKFGSLNGPNGFLDTGCTYLIGYLNTSTTFGGVILGTSAITKVGTGSLTLSGASTYTGLTTVENGALIVGANVPASGNGPFGNTTSAIALGDTTSESANQNVSLLVGGAFTMARPVTVGAGNATTATFTLGGNTTNNAVISGNLALNQYLIVTQATGGILTLSGSINENVAGKTLTKVGGGTVILSGANNYSGQTMVNSGALLIANSSAANGSVTVANGAIAGVSATADATYWSPSSLTVNAGGSLQFNLGGTITGPNSSTLLTPSSLTLNGATTVIIGSCPQVLGLYPLFNNYSAGALTLGSQPAGVIGKLTVSSGTVYYEVTNFVTMRWTAAVNTNWDTVTANWTNSIGGNKYVAGYPVLFDDTASGASPLLVNITNAVAPNSFTVNNTSKAYIIGGLTIGGATGLTKTGNNTLTLTGTNTFAGDIAVSAGTLEIGGAGQLGGGSYSGAIQNDGALKVNSSAAQTLSGAISGNGAVIKDNGGTLTLVAANAGLNGNVTNRAGTIQVNASGAFGNGTLVLDGGAVVNGGSSDVAIANNIEVGSGGGSITLGVAKNLDLTGSLSGSGNLTLGGPNPLSSLNLFFPGNTFSGTITIPNSTGVNQTVTRFKVASAGSASAAWSIGGAQDRANSLDFDGTIEFGSLSGSGIIGGNGGGAKTLSVGALNTSTTFNGSIRDVVGIVGSTVGLTKVGNGTLTLNGVNTYTGPTLVNGGALVVSSLMTGAGDYTVADGATLGVKTVNGGSLAVASLTLGSSASCTNLFINIASITNAAVTNLGALTVNGTVAVSVQGVFPVGQYALIGSAGGFAGSGGFVIGTLPPGAAATLFTNGNTLYLNVTAPPTPQLWTGLNSGNWDFATTNWSLSSSPALFTEGASAVFDDSSTRTNVTLTTNVSPAAVLVTNNTRNYSFTGTGGAKLTGAAAFTKTGTGKLTLTGLTNDFTGQFTVGGGLVVVDGNAALGAGTVNLNGGALSPSQSFTLAKTVLVGPAAGSGSGGINVDSGLALTNNTAMTDNTSGSGTLVKSGSGTLQLGANSTYTGGTIVSNGALVLASGGAIGPVRGTLTIAPGATVNLAAVDALGYNNDATRVSAVNVNGGTLNNTTAGNQAYRTLLNLTGGTVSSTGGGAYNFTTGQTISSLASATLSSITAPIQLRDTATLNFDVAAGSVPGGTDLSVSGVIAQQFAGSSVLKLGAGKMALSATNTYTGTTTVSNGTLLVNGLIPGAVAVSGGVFGGTGIVGGAVTVDAGSTLSPGASVGALTISNNLALAGNLFFELDKSLAPGLTNDYVIVSGTLANTGTGTLTLTNVGPALAAGDTFKLFSQPLTGGDLLTLAPALPGGLAWTNKLAVDGTVAVIATSSTPTPAQLTNSVSGGVLSLTWPAGQGWKLQVQTNSRSVGLKTNWFDVPGSTSLSGTNITLDKTQPTIFYRLAYP